MMILDAYIRTKGTRSIGKWVGKGRWGRVATYLGVMVEWDPAKELVKVHHEFDWLEG